MNSETALDRILSRTGELKTLAPQVWTPPPFSSCMYIARSFSFFPSLVFALRVSRARSIHSFALSQVSTMQGTSPWAGPFSWTTRVIDSSNRGENHISRSSPSPILFSHVALRKMQRMPHISECLAHACLESFFSLYSQLAFFFLLDRHD